MYDTYVHPQELLRAPSHTFEMEHPSDSSRQLPGSYPPTTHEETCSLRQNAHGAHNYSTEELRPHGHRSYQASVGSLHTIPTTSTRWLETPNRLDVMNQTMNEGALREQTVPFTHSTVPRPPECPNLYSNSTSPFDFVRKLLPSTPPHDDLPGLCPHPLRTLRPSSPHYMYDDYDTSVSDAIILTPGEPLVPSDLSIRYQERTVMEKDSAKRESARDALLTAQKVLDERMQDQTLIKNTKANQAMKEVKTEVDRRAEMRAAAESKDHVGSEGRPPLFVDNAGNHSDLAATHKTNFPSALPKSRADCESLSALNEKAANKQDVEKQCDKAAQRDLYAESAQGMRETQELMTTRVEYRSMRKTATDAQMKARARAALQNALPDVTQAKEMAEREVKERIRRQVSEKAVREYREKKQKLEARRLKVDREAEAKVTFVREVQAKLRKQEADRVENVQHEAAKVNALAEQLHDVQINSDSESDVEDEEGWEKVRDPDRVEWEIVDSLDC